MLWNPDVLNKYVAPAISQFTSVSIPTLNERFPQAPHWLVNHFLSNVLRASFKPQWRQIVLAYIRRSHNAFLTYHEARHLTLEYLDGNDPLNPRIQRYFDAVSAWENFALQVSMAIELFNWLNQGENAFKSNDGSKEQRLYDTANQIKHTAKTVNSGQCTERHTIPLWLSNDGLCSFGILVTYTEAAEVLIDISKLADEYQDPLSFQAP